MRVYVSALLVTIVAASAAVEGVRAQSLAELARKEEERRQAAKQAKAPKSRVYTNKDVGNVPAAPPQATGAPAEAKPESDGSDAAEKGKKDAAPAVQEPAKDQAYWRERLRGLQGQLERDRTYADALQSRINALTADFVNTDDPARRSAIGADRQRAVSELERLTKAIADQQQAMADFQEEARRAGVPPGWLR